MLLMKLNGVFHFIDFGVQLTDVLDNLAFFDVKCFQGRKWTGVKCRFQGTSTHLAYINFQHHVTQ